MHVNEELKVAIIGKTPHKALAPYGDPSWEIWTLSDLPCGGQVPRWTRHFELHPLDWFRERNDQIWDFLKQPHDKPVYVQELAADVPAGVLFPKGDVLRHLPRAYMTNTVSWLMGYASLLGASEVGVWGVDMALDTEYGHQRPSCEYMVGWLEGQGCKVTIPDESDLLKARCLYGFDHSRDFEEKLRHKVEELQQRHGKQARKFEEVSNDLQQRQLNLARLEGALDMTGWIKQWSQS